MTIYYFDVDNTITKTKDGDYPNAKPVKKRIAKVNELAQKGHKIVMCTARGAQTGIDWIPFTRKQLDDWGVQYHELARKPYYDVLVDDHAFNDKQYFNGN